MVSLIYSSLHETLKKVFFHNCYIAYELYDPLK